MLIAIQTTQLQTPCQSLMVDDVLQLQKVVCHLFLTRYIQRCRQADLPFTRYQPLVIYRKALFDAEYADGLVGGYKQARKACLQAILALGKRGIVQYLDDQMMINYAKYRTVALSNIVRRLQYLNDQLSQGSLTQVKQPTDKQRKQNTLMTQRRIERLRQLQSWLEEV